MKNKPRDLQESDLPDNLAQPARRALAAAGCLRLAQLAMFSEADVRQWHGIGPKALEQLRQALDAQGLSFAEGKKQEDEGRSGRPLIVI